MKKEKRCSKCKQLEENIYLCDMCKQDLMISDSFIFVEEGGKNFKFCSYECLDKFSRSKINKPNNRPGIEFGI